MIDKIEEREQQGHWTKNQPTKAGRDLHYDDTPKYEEYEYFEIFTMMFGWWWSEPEILPDPPKDK